MLRSSLLDIHTKNLFPNYRLEGVVLAYPAALSLVETTDGSPYRVRETRTIRQSFLE